MGKFWVEVVRESLQEFDNYDTAVSVAIQEVADGIGGGCEKITVRVLDSLNRPLLVLTSRHFQQPECTYAVGTFDETGFAGKHGPFNDYDEVVSTFFDGVEAGDYLVRCATDGSITRLARWRKGRWRKLKGKKHVQ